jgi:hypothetical protein
MTCPTPTNTDLLRLTLGEFPQGVEPTPLLTLLGLEVFAEVCVVIRTADGASTVLTPQQLALLVQLVQQINQIIMEIENLSNVTPPV